AGAAQLAGDAFVVGSEAGATIEHEDGGIRLLEGLHALAQHQRVDAGSLAGDAAGVDHDVGLGTDLAVTILAVAGQPRLVRDQRVTAAGEEIEERGLAYVRPAKQCDYGKQ